MLRPERLKWALYQKDLTALVPSIGHDRVSCVERGLSQPSAREIVAYRLIFGTLPEEIFPGLVSEVEDTVLRNAYEMHRRLEGKTSKRAECTRAFLEAILARAVKSTNAKKV